MRLILLFTLLYARKTRYDGIVGGNSHDEHGQYVIKNIEVIHFKTFIPSSTQIALKFFLLYWKNRNRRQCINSPSVWPTPRTSRKCGKPRCFFVLSIASAKLKSCVSFTFRPIPVPSIGWPPRAVNFESLINEIKPAYFATSRSFLGLEIEKNMTPKRLRVIRINQDTDQSVIKFDWKRAI